MNNAAFQDEAAPVQANVLQLVAAPELLKTVWPDDHSRPSLRWLRCQQRTRSFPSNKVGRKVLFCPAHVLAFAGARLTVLPQRWTRAGNSLGQMPAPDALIGAIGLTQFLNQELGVKRSLRWVRQQQKDRTLPYIRWGRKIFFSPSQIKAALQSQNQR